MSDDPQKTAPIPEQNPQEIVTPQARVVYPEFTAIGRALAEVSLTPAPVVTVLARAAVELTGDKLPSRGGDGDFSPLRRTEDRKKPDGEDSTYDGCTPKRKRRQNDDTNMDPQRVAFELARAAWLAQTKTARVLKRAEPDSQPSQAVRDVARQVLGNRSRIPAGILPLIGNDPVGYRQLRNPISAALRPALSSPLF